MLYRKSRKGGFPVKTSKKILCVLISALLIAGALTAAPFSAFADEIDKGAPAAFAREEGLYVHAVQNSADANAWHLWQSVHDTQMSVVNEYEKYFFLPSSVKGGTADIYNSYPSAVSVNGTVIASGSTEEISFEADRGYYVSTDRGTYTLRFRKSGAEAAVFVNNPDADGNGTELHEYLKVDKSRSAAATGAIVNPDGKLDNTPIKKIKGRGNTTWYPEKKGFNITYESKVSVGGMAKCKKYSILANFQDDSLSRNRFLYDLSDAVGMPYASDSRYVDFYIDGFYRGSYQLCEKVDTGSLVTDVDGSGYLNDDGSLKEDFSFIAEVDASAGDEDYYFNAANGTKITLKAPELDPGQPYYDEVKAYCKEKFDRFAAAAADPDSDLSEVADPDSLTKLWLINELGKNWDSGVSSTFFTYKPDENGNYKFYGSPVWDYDNSLGNANGVGSDLSSMGVSDYTKYTGWWCRFKGESRNQSSSSNNLINQFSVHNQLAELAPVIWFEEFMPAIDHFAGKRFNEAINGELKTASDYYALIADSAANNYLSGWAIYTGSWIADHSGIYKADFDTSTRTYSVSSSETNYDQNSFGDMFNYAADWMTSRAAWISNEWARDYYGVMTLGDVNFDRVINIKDATTVQKVVAKLLADNANRNAAADVNTDLSVDINDVTCIQKYIAKLGDCGFVGQPVGTYTLGERQVVFTNSLDWEGPIYCYYWTSGQSIQWPGEEMTYLRQNQFGEDQYTLVIPDWATYIIFDNGVGKSQTDNIPFDGSVLGYYALSETNQRGRHYYGTFDPSDE